MCQAFDSVLTVLDEIRDREAKGGGPGMEMTQQEAMTKLQEQQRYQRYHAADGTKVKGGA